jgi:hypothetical protein
MFRDIFNIYTLYDASQSSSLFFDTLLSKHGLHLPIATLDFFLTVWITVLAENNVIKYDI